LPRQQVENSNLRLAKVQSIFSQNTPMMSFKIIIQPKI